MGRPPLLEGWWKRVCDQLAGGRVDVLANLFDVNPRTLNRYSKGELKAMRETKRKQVRRLIGKEFYDAKDAPKFLRTRKKKVKTKA